MKATLFGSRETIEGYCKYCGGKMVSIDGHLHCYGDPDCLCEMEEEGGEVNEKD